jgi:hypothetical protein
MSVPVVIDGVEYAFDRAKFDSRHESDGDCWRWTGWYQSSGYGAFRIGGNRGKDVRAHRLSWILANGPIEQGLLVCHRCDHPWCVNPEHLFLGTAKDNIRDCAEKGRRKVGRIYRGVDSSQAALSADDVRAIRASDLSSSALSRMYGVAHNTIRRARSGFSYREVSP